MALSLTHWMARSAVALSGNSPDAATVCPISVVSVHVHASGFLRPVLLRASINRKCPGMSAMSVPSLNRLFSNYAVSSTKHGGDDGYGRITTMSDSRFDEKFNLPDDTDPDEVLRKLLAAGTEETVEEDEVSEPEA